MTEEEKRLHHCCFTGHRPEKLYSSKRKIKKELEEAITDAIEDGFTTFISGMARGVDMWAAEIVLKKRKKDERIKLIFASPFKGFETSREPKEQKQHHRLINDADAVEFICEHYSKNCFQMRNCYMVDHSKRVIAVFNGESGGTKNTLFYAMRNGIETVIIEDKIQ